MMQKTIHILWLVLCFSLGCFIAASFTNKAEAADPATCVLIGDSITSEVYPSVIGGPKGHPRQLAVNLIQEERGVHIRNLSGPGSSLGAGGAGGFANIVPALEAIGGPFSFTKCIIIQAGTNDFGLGVNMNATVTSFRNILNYARRTKKRVMVVDLIYRSDQANKNKVGLTLDHYRWNRAYICNVEYPDVCKFLSRDGTAFAAMTPNFYTPAEIQVNWAVHLTAAGHRAYADWIKNFAIQHGYF
jgi:hypothetical protein